MKSLSDQKKGSLLAFVAVMFITPDSLFIRFFNVDTCGLVFYRGAIPFFTVLIGMLIIYKANFFPKRSYLLKVVGKGFGRHQIRLMMGALIQLGKSEISLNYIKDSLKIESDIKIDYIAPANGLILNNIEFN